LKSIPPHGRCGKRLMANLQHREEYEEAVHG